MFNKNPLAPDNSTEPSSTAVTKTQKAARCGFRWSLKWREWNLSNAVMALPLIGLGVVIALMVGAVVGPANIGAYICYGFGGVLIFSPIVASVQIVRKKKEELETVA